MGYRVVALSSGPSKQEMAHALGAHEYVDGSAVDAGAALNALGGAQLVLETVQDATAIQKVLPGLTVGGTLLLIALESSSIAVSPGECRILRAW